MSHDAPKAAVEGGRAPTDEVGIYLYTHEHSWVETRSLRAPRGTWHPVFVCEVCTDEVCDYGTTDYAEPAAAGVSA